MGTAMLQWLCLVFVSLQLLPGSYCTVQEENVSIDERIIIAANTTQEFEFFYDEHHALVKVELDMVFSMEEWAEIQMLNASWWEENPAKRTAGIISGRGGGRYWSGNTVPYDISGSFSSRDRQQIQAAVNDWNRYTCLNLRPARSGDRNRIRFQNGGG
ncbi:low choriolytic enzyme-like [Plakobranchus ocellatus]|uniref:Low choriolytic enzyme-like n=1 Tax=Plakobranchus ocellatus TaxID=259542 RepID=A0AAV3XTV3_9GAST|nr:low choriolytic enzyme-like [Plakobranchus ocellatus]